MKQSLNNALKEAIHKMYIPKEIKGKYTFTVDEVNSCIVIRKIESKLIKIRLIKDYDVESFLLEGSVIHDCKELKKHYKGIHTSMFGSYVVKIPKTFCEVINKQ